MSTDQTSMNDRPFVLVGPSGLVYVGLHKDEDSCWQIALGWPSKDEIEHHRRLGFSVHPATLTWRK